MKEKCLLSVVRIIIIYVNFVYILSYNAILKDQQNVFSKIAIQI